MYGIILKERLGLGFGLGNFFSAILREGKGKLEPRLVVR